MLRRFFIGIFAASLLLGGVSFASEEISEERIQQRLEREWKELEAALPPMMDTSEQVVYKKNFFKNFRNDVIEMLRAEKAAGATLKP